MRAITLALATALLAGCGQEQAPEPTANILDEELPAIPDVVPPRGCAADWSAVLDKGSFAVNGAGVTFPRERLEQFRAMAEDSIRIAVNAACKDGLVKPEAAAAIRTVTLFSASGAPAPVFFALDKPDRLNLESPFAEDDLSIPSEMELRAGLVCWTNPEGDDCAAMEP
jgi:hypothetical protein